MSAINNELLTFGNRTRLREAPNDELMTRDTIRGIVDFLLKQAPDDRLRNSYYQLKVVPLTAQKCSAILDLIHQHSSIYIVEDSKNRLFEVDLIITVYERSMNTDDLRLPQLIGDNMVKYLNDKEAMTYNFITISKTAYQTLQRYYENIQSNENSKKRSISKEKIVRFSDKNDIIPLLPQPKPPERCCTCTLL